MSDDQRTMYRSEKTADYTQLSNSMLRDERLSFKARGILAMILSNSDTWEVYHGWLEERGTEGREAIRSGVQELERFGYVTYAEIRRGGQFISRMWVWHERPVSEDKRTDRTNWKAPQDGKPSDGLPSDGKPSPKKTIPSEDHQKEELALISETDRKNGTATPASLSSLPDFAPAWKEFTETRKKKRKPLTDRASASILNRLAERPQSAIVAVDAMLEFGWDSFEWGWDKLVARLATKTNGHKPDTAPAGYPDFLSSPEGRQYAAEYPRWATIPPSSDFVKRDFHNWMKSKA